KHRKFRGTSLLPAPRKDGSYQHQVELADLEDKRSALAVKQADLQGQIQAMEQLLKEQRDQEALAVALQHLPDQKHGATGPRPFEEQLFQLQMQEEKLRGDGFGEDYPPLRSVLRLIARAKEQQKKLNGDGPDAKLSLSPVQRYLAGLRNKLAE